MDYYIPNFSVPDNKTYYIGKYSRLHSKFIKENRPCFYSMKMLNGTWLAYLEEIDIAAKVSSYALSHENERIFAVI